MLDCLPVAASCLFLAKSLILHVSVPSYEVASRFSSLLCWSDNVMSLTAIICCRAWIFLSWFCALFASPLLCTSSSAASVNCLSTLSLRTLAIASKFVVLPRQKSIFVCSPCVCVFRGGLGEGGVGCPLLLLWGCDSSHRIGASDTILTGCISSFAIAFSFLPRRCCTRPLGLCLVIPFPGCAGNSGAVGSVSSMSSASDSDDPDSFRSCRLFPSMLASFFFVDFIPGRPLWGCS